MIAGCPREKGYLLVNVAQQETERNVKNPLIRQKNNRKKGSQYRCETEKSPLTVVGEVDMYDVYLLSLSIISIKLSMAQDLVLSTYPLSTE